MIVYKCKMCDANLPIESGKKIVKCNYCDTFQSIPSCDDEKKATLFNRANHFRQNGEFDKAYSIYEHILEEDESDPEVYWSIVLCKYGIEYVEDPGTKKRKATVNRTQKHSILQDADYLTALEKADDDLKKFYSFEAAYVDNVQKKILSIANEEKGYDVFISYKEKGPDGNRTRSSVLAQDLYDRLEKAGYRTFFSRISLEDKLGSEYEPYIYSALQSSKVMLVIGTKKEEFTAPWVKNEWSRYLLAMKENSNKKLIPCYCDIDAYDLPDEFQVLQGQDMSKIGYEQDLIRGIGKILSSTASIDLSNVSNEETRMFKNGETYLLLGNYSDALATYMDLCKKVPGDYRAWWGRIRAASKDLKDANALTDNYNDFKNWMEYVRKLTDEMTYKDLIEKFCEYIKKASSQMAYAEIEKAKIIKDNSQKVFQDTERDIAYLQNNKSYELIKIEEKYRGLDESFSLHENNIKTLQKQKESNNSKCFVALFMFALFFFCSFAMFNDKPVVAVGEFFFSFFFAYGAKGFYDLAKKDKRTIENHKQALSGLETQRKNKSIEIQKQIDSDNIHLQSLYTKKQNNGFVKDAALRYINMDPNRIIRLLESLMFRDFGLERPLDNELVNIRNNVFQTIK